MCDERRKSAGVPISCRKKGELLFSVLDSGCCTWAPKSAGQRFTKTSIPRDCVCARCLGGKLLALSREKDGDHPDKLVY